MFVNIMHVGTGLATEAKTFRGPLDIKISTVKLQPFNNHAHQLFKFIDSKAFPGFFSIISCAEDNIDGCEWALELVGDHIKRVKADGSESQMWRCVQEQPCIYIIYPMSRATHFLGVDSDCRLICHADFCTWRIVPTSPTLFPPFSESERKMYTIGLNDIKTSLHSMLDEYGFCIIRGVLSPQDLLTAETLWGKDLLRVLDMNAADAAQEHCNSAALLNILNVSLTDDASKIPALWPGSMAHSGVEWIERNSCAAKDEYSRHGLPHGEMPWFVRLHPNVRFVFETVYGTGADNLVVGMDKIFFNPKGVPPKEIDRIWGHADMNIHRNGVKDWDAYQSVVALWPLTGTDVSTTVVWPGSHHQVFDKLMQAPGLDTRGQHIRLDTLQGPFGAWINECYVRQARRVPLDAGNMIIWSSKLIHQGWSNGPRLAVPVCFEPRSRRDVIAFNRKVRLCASGIPSTHWASLAIPHTLSLEDVRKGRCFSMGTLDSDFNIPLLESVGPACLIDPSAYIEIIIPLCKALEDSGDTDDEISSEICRHLRPDIVAFL